jgi:hypothetical protein
MWLLKLDGEIISRVAFYENDLPEYATLSHTWGEDEVTFEDIRRGTGRDKTGYRKLVRCGRLAADDGLKFFWADTCCVDRPSSAQLPEDTKKTFECFRDATRCYVLLADVSWPVGSDPLWFDFEKSRWFTSSWTLQELLASRVLDFFSAEGNRIGDKKSLTQRISNITGIPIRALEGDPLSEFSVQQIFGWAQRRQAISEEDEVYSLFGIFDIHLPLIYGEGRESARLRLLAAVPHDRHILPSDPSLTVNLYDNRLAANRFRLLIVHPDKLGSPITADLQESDLSDPPFYSALSYVWGQEPALHPITIDYNVKVWIRPNLFHALQRIRARNTGKFRVWVDSLCINQSDDVERNEQVGRMSQIYSKAGGVFVWLGEEDATSKIAIDLSFDIYQHSSKLLKDPGRPHPVSWNDAWWRVYGFTALSLLLERPWFRRGWVLQEAAFAKNAMMQCGDKQIELNQFSFVVDLVREKLRHNLEAMDVINNRTNAGTLMNFIDSPAVRMLDIVKGAFDWSDEKVDFPRPKMSLETLVHLGTFSETSDERDSIYALLNLANDTETSSTLFRVVPDYRKSILGVYADFVRHCHSHSGSLDILCRPWAPAPSFREQSNLDNNDLSQQLPSWIASRERLPFGDPSWRLKHRLHGNPLVGSNLKPNYNAHGGKPAAVEWPTGCCPDTLFVKGFVLTDVWKISSRMANAIITAESLEVLGDYRYGLPASVWRTFCAGRNDIGDPAPESYSDAMRQVIRISTYNDIWSDAISIDIEELIEYEEIPKLAKDFLLVVRDVVWNRRTFQSKPLDATDRHFVGLIPQNARVGDQICILYGCSVPVVLRKYKALDGNFYWRLVGDAYVHGVMDGELFEQAPEELIASNEVVFEIR